MSTPPSRSIRGSEFGIAKDTSVKRTSIPTPPPRSSRYPRETMETSSTTSAQLRSPRKIRPSNTAGPTVKPSVDPHQRPPTHRPKTFEMNDFPKDDRTRQSSLQSSSYVPDGPLKTGRRHNYSHDIPDDPTDLPSEPPEAPRGSMTVHKTPMTTTPIREGSLLATLLDLEAQVEAKAAHYVDLLRETQRRRLEVERRVNKDVSTELPVLSRALTLIMQQCFEAEKISESEKIAMIDEPEFRIEAIDGLDSDPELAELQQTILEAELCQARENMKLATGDTSSIKRQEIETEAIARALIHFQQKKIEKAHQDLRKAVANTQEGHEIAFDLTKGGFEDDLSVADPSEKDLVPRGFGGQPIDILPGHESTDGVPIIGFALPGSQQVVNALEGVTPIPSDGESNQGFEASKKAIEKVMGDTITALKTGDLKDVQELILKPSEIGSLLKMVSEANNQGTDCPYRLPNNMKELRATIDAAIGEYAGTGSEIPLPSSVRRGSFQGSTREIELPQGPGEGYQSPPTMQKANLMEILMEHMVDDIDHRVDCKRAWRIPAYPTGCQLVDEMIPPSEILRDVEHFNLNPKVDLIRNFLSNSEALALLQFSRSEWDTYAAVPGRRDIGGSDLIEIAKINGPSRPKLVNRLIGRLGQLMDVNCAPEHAVFELRKITSSAYLPLGFEATQSTGFLFIKVANSGCNLEFPALKLRTPSELGSCIFWRNTQDGTKFDNQMFNLMSTAKEEGDCLITATIHFLQ